jgi:hypothetical protein
MELTSSRHTMLPAGSDLVSASPPSAEEAVVDEAFRRMDLPARRVALSALLRL